MRSRSKKGEVGQCCARPWYRPEPIEIMVLPTETQPESLNCLSSYCWLAYCIVRLRPPREGKPHAVVGSETIQHNSSPRKAGSQQFCRLPNWANVVPIARIRDNANAMPDAPAPSIVRAPPVDRQSQLAVSSYGFDAAARQPVDLANGGQVARDGSRPLRCDESTDINRQPSNRLLPRGIPA